MLLGCVLVPLCDTLRELLVRRQIGTSPVVCAAENRFELVSAPNRMEAGELTTHAFFVGSEPLLLLLPRLLRHSSLPPQLPLLLLPLLLALLESLDRRKRMTNLVPLRSESDGSRQGTQGLEQLLQAI